jgi:hypothetical protein
MASGVRSGMLRRCITCGKQQREATMTTMTTMKNNDEKQHETTMKRMRNNRDAWFTLSYGVWFLCRIEFVGS